MLASDLKTSTIYKDNEEPYVVLKYTHVKTARGGATVKVKVRNLITGSVFEKSYLSSAKVADADVRRKKMQYLYDSNGFVFMDHETYDQVVISENVVGEAADFLKEGESVHVLYFEENPVSVDLPNTMIFEITYTEPGFKGNTVSNVYKDATLENGAKVKVPTFLKIGDKVKVDTRSGSYVSKA